MAASYQVIARRWRPRRFSELVGQDHIVRTLRNAIEKGRIAHAFLFVGPRGTGKTSTARLFSCALNAEDGPRIDADPDSPICQSIMSGSSMDVIEIDGASNNSVDQVRDLREDCQYAPSQCRFKIYIIDEVHMLSTAAFNALLKTLEEPPEHVKFIFATTEANKVLPTIVSRCQRFEFRPIENAVIAAKLVEIATKENITVAPEAIEAVTRLANGGMRDAQSILDQLISFCGDSISETDVLNVYGLASKETIQQLAASIAAGDYPALLTAIDQVIQDGRDVGKVLNDLQDLIRAALLDAIRAQGRSALLGAERSSEELLRMLEAVRSGSSGVTRGLSERAGFELALLRAVEQSRSRALDTVLAEIAELKKKNLLASPVLHPEPNGPTTAKRSLPDPGQNPNSDSESISFETPTPESAAPESGEIEIPSKPSQPTPDPITEARSRLHPDIRKFVEEEMRGEFIDLVPYDPSTLD
ncbi:MAG: DNA polymerase III subunit gamma/tau [Puniceicoccaceae bacterium]